MKIKLELNIPDDRIFLNFWDWNRGMDVVCEVIDGKLVHEGQEISLSWFIVKVKEIAKYNEK